MCLELGSGRIAAWISDLEDGFPDDSLGYCASVGYLLGLIKRFVVAVSRSPRLAPDRASLARASR
jgi:hypothetical protein